MRQNHLYYKYYISIKKNNQTQHGHFGGPRLRKYAKIL